MTKGFKKYRLVKPDLSSADFVAFIAGTCPRNPGGPCGMGVEIRSHGRKFTGISTKLHTENQAAYAALLMALKKAHQFSARIVLIFTSDRILCRRTKPRLARAHHPNLIPLNRRALRLIGRLESFRISWVPPGENTVARRLARKGFERALEALERSPIRKAQSNCDA